jgi:hypothetical protein
MVWERYAQQIRTLIAEHLRICMDREINTALPWDTGEAIRANHTERLAAYQERNGADSYPAFSTEQRWAREAEQAHYDSVTAKRNEFAAARDSYFVALTPDELLEIQAQGYAAHNWPQHEFATVRLSAIADVEYVFDLQAQRERQRIEAERVQAERREAERKAQEALNLHKPGLERAGCWERYLPNIKRLLRALRGREMFVAVLVQGFGSHVAEHTLDIADAWRGYGREFRDDDLESQEAYLLGFAARHKWPSPGSPRLRYSDYRDALIPGGDARTIELDGKTMVVSRHDIGSQIYICEQCDTYVRRGDHYQGADYVYCSMDCAESADDTVRPANIMDYGTNVRDVCGRDFGYAKHERPKAARVLTNGPGIIISGPRLFLGVELEVCPTGSDYGEIAADVRQELKERVICKEDGSISGFEIVSIPGTLAWHKELWTPWFDGKGSVKQVKGWGQGGYGMHVHMSRNAMSTFAWSKLNVFINDPENSSFVTRIAGREATTYCHRFKKRIADPNKLMDGRYEALNFNGQRGDTVECRIFQSNVAKAGFFKNLEFCHAAARWAQQASIQRLKVAEFHQWVNRPDNRATYPFLTGFLAEKFTPAELGA